MSHDQRIEVLLFALARPLTIKRLVELTALSIEEGELALKDLETRLQESKSSLQIVRQGNEVELVSRPEFAELLRAAQKTEVQTELTRPSLEALAILAYRGPMTRPELEQIRGVQSSLILRNLLLRGLVEMKEDVRLGQPTYAVTIDFVKYLGITKVAELPNYADLRGHPLVEQMMQELQNQTTSAESHSIGTLAAKHGSPETSLEV